MTAGTEAFKVSEVIFRLFATIEVLKVFKRRFETFSVKLVELKVTLDIDAFKVEELMFRFDATIEVLKVFM